MLYRTLIKFMGDGHTKEITYRGDVIGWLWTRREWFSACSIHRFASKGLPKCTACQAGQYIFSWKHRVGAFALTIDAWIVNFLKINYNPYNGDWNKPFNPYRKDLR